MTPKSRALSVVTDIPAPAASLLALVLSLLTSGALFLLTQFEQVNHTTIALIFLLPVGLSASLWGLLPGISAASVSFLTFNYFFIPIQYTFQVKQSEDLVVLAAFLAVAAVISELTGRVRRNLESATAREHEAIRLYEFSISLASTSNQPAAGRVLLDTIDQTIHPDRIEVLIESSPKAIFLTRGNMQLSSNATKPYILPLQTTRDLIGEFRLWTQKPIMETDERLLKIFASQSSLAIERIHLADAAHKARLLEESDRLKSSLLSSVSHELRSPLATIKASVSSLRTGDVEWDSDARTELLTTVEEEIDLLNGLVGNLLDMSRIEAGVLRPQKKPNMLREIANAALGHIRPQIQNIRIVMDISEELPLVNVDFVQMQQVFFNLLTNSLKYSPAGSEINITTTPHDHNFVLVTLTNQSLPVPEADMERIFDKFYRINPTEQITGSGLGLSICKGIIEAHGGKIWAENLADRLAFIFTVPISSHD